MSRRMRVTVSLPGDLVRRLDKFSRAQGASRSGLMERWLRRASGRRQVRRWSASSRRITRRPRTRRCPRPSAAPRVRRRLPGMAPGAGRGGEAGNRSLGPARQAPPGDRPFAEREESSGERGDHRPLLHLGAPAALARAVPARRSGAAGGVDGDVRADRDRPSGLGRPDATRHAVRAPDARCRACGALRHRHRAARRLRRRATACSPSSSACPTWRCQTRLRCATRLSP